MAVFDLEREKELKKLPYDQAMQMLWQWIKQDVVSSRCDFVRAVEIIQEAKRARAASFSWD
jgi:hypothetical protein